MERAHFDFHYYVGYAILSIMKYLLLTSPNAQGPAYKQLNDSRARLEDYLDREFSS